MFPSYGGLRYICKKKCLKIRIRDPCLSQKMNINHNLKNILLKNKKINKIKSKSTNLRGLKIFLLGYYTQIPEVKSYNNRHNFLKNFLKKLNEM